MNIAETPAKFLATDLLARFVAIVGSKNAITDREAQAPYLTEPRDMLMRMPSRPSAASTCALIRCLVSAPPGVMTLSTSTSRAMSMSLG